MKTIEEKARAYDEALERARKIHKYSSDLAEIKRMEYIFSELHESDDELIRKELIDTINLAYDCGIAITKEYRDKYLAWLEKQGEENSADKIEPEFHEGDWVVYKNDICQIVKREEGCNKLVTVFGIEKELVNERNLSTARLWTIEDAKPGDILVVGDEDGTGIAICGKNDELGNNILYCYYDDEYGFATNTPIALACLLHPTTKEQRDILFAKMHEAGYMWDSKSKQLLSLKAEPSDIQTPTGWSEEDESMYTRTLGVLGKCYMGQLPTKVEEELKWFKSLKQKIVG